MRLNEKGRRLLVQWTPFFRKIKRKTSTLLRAVDTRYLVVLLFVVLPIYTIGAVYLLDVPVRKLRYQSSSLPSTRLTGRPVFVRVDIGGRTVQFTQPSTAELLTWSDSAGGRAFLVRDVVALNDSIHAADGQFTAPLPLTDFAVTDVASALDKHGLVYGTRQLQQVDTLRWSATPGRRGSVTVSGTRGVVAGIRGEFEEVQIDYTTMIGSPAPASSLVINVDHDPPSFGTANHLMFSLMDVSATSLRSEFEDNEVESAARYYTLILQDAEPWQLRLIGPFRSSWRGRAVGELQPWLLDVDSLDSLSREKLRYVDASEITTAFFRRSERGDLTIGDSLRHLDFPHDLSVASSRRDFYGHLQYNRRRGFEYEDWTDAVRVEGQEAIPPLWKDLPAGVMAALVVSLLAVIGYLGKRFFRF